MRYNRSIMSRLSRLTRISLLLAAFFALDKGLAILRQMIIARQFGLSPELDAFNAANNLPDLLFALISGGALAIAFIPVLSEVLTRQGRPPAWELFSRIANLAFLVTAGLAVVIALLSNRLVGAELGIAPGFTAAQQGLVVELMRLNLIATLLFSVSGLVMAGLQANQHFLLPAIAPLLYNLGQIFGALVLAPAKGLHIGPLALPGFGLGVYGLVYGVILGAALHLAVQIPALLRYQFHWTPSIDLRNPLVRKVLALLGPRLLTMLFIQLIFLARDNLASRLEAGAVTALTYGWMLMQVPETLIGTAIGTALLPTLAEQFAGQDWTAFKQTVERASRVLLALTLPVAAILAFGLRPVLQSGFGFDERGTQLVMWATQAYLAGLAGHSLMEVAARAFYARQNALLPLLASAFSAAAFTGLSILLMPALGAAGIALSNSIAFTAEAVLLLGLLSRRLPGGLSYGPTLLRALLAAAVGGGLTYLIQARLPGGLTGLLLGLVAMLICFAVTLPIIWKEARQLFRL